jgi:hypothetical protein
MVFAEIDISWRGAREPAGMREDCATRRREEQTTFVSDGDAAILTECVDTLYCNEGDPAESVLLGHFLYFHARREIIAITSNKASNVRSRITPGIAIAMMFVMGKSAPPAKSIEKFIFNNTLHESGCDMARYFTSRCSYFHEPQAS